MKDSDAFFKDFNKKDFEKNKVYLQISNAEAENDEMFYSEEDDEIEARKKMQFELSRIFFMTKYIFN